MERSNTDPVLIFKHSTQCSVSGVALDEFKAFIDTAKNVTCGVVRVIEDREVSNTIANALHVRHASPQVIVVENGRATWHASHWSITSDALRDAISHAE